MGYLPWKSIEKKSWALLTLENIKNEKVILIQIVIFGLIYCKGSSKSSDSKYIQLVFYM